jgi:hypothetical protein
MLVESYLEPDSGAGLRAFIQLNHARLNGQAQLRSLLQLADKQSPMPPTPGSLRAKRKAHRADVRCALLTAH